MKAKQFKIQSADALLMMKIAETFPDPDEFDEYQEMCETELARVEMMHMQVCDYRRHF